MLQHAFHYLIKTNSRKKKKILLLCFTFLLFMIRAIICGTNFLKCEINLRVFGVDLYSKYNALQASILFSI